MQLAENLGRQYQRSGLNCQQCGDDLPVPDKAKVIFF